MNECSIDGCSKKAVKRGWCETHYARWRINGSPAYLPKYDYEKRFWERVEKTQGCWIWLGSGTKFGYGHLKIKNKTVMAHRYSYEITKGVIPKGLIVCHKCDNPKCVNPDHLFLGTYKDNSNDRDIKGRARDQRGVKHNFAKLNDDSVRIIRESNKKGVELAKIFGVSSTQISAIRSRRNWAHVR